MAKDELPAFDGTGSGYGWSISAWQFWNSRGTLEAQRLAEVSHAFSGRSSIWFHLWSLWNPNADWDTFDLAFLHQFESAMRPLLPEICWNQVEDWEIEWIEMRARLLRQPKIDSETKSQSEPEIAAAEIQEKKEVEENANPVPTHPFIIDPKSQAEADWENSTEISNPDQAEFHHLDPDPNLIQIQRRSKSRFPISITATN
ncbi:hypothetical protein PIB30_019638 [Stylosanthes scabra]|uniref:Uncharacterized protein n=1 Tax=Stylosanthes scabra TaxID=79078 RepID=A0ABU6S8J6_9FABA|nr:hypothetical protein [Stylosanthes scabra]